MMTVASPIHENFEKITQQIRLLEKKYKREPHSVSLLAASKGQSIERIHTAIECGQKIFGENYVQEAIIKMDIIKNPNVEWHFIGVPQSNKTKYMAELFSWVHTVCDRKVVQRLSDQRPKELAPLQICIEVNISHETSKSGITDIYSLKDLAQFCKTLPGICLRGLMTVPAPSPNLESQRAEFRKLFNLQQKLIESGFELDTLSMGMTDDMEAAIAEGSTIVRIGRGLLGERL